MSNDDDEEERELGRKFGAVVYGEGISFLLLSSWIVVLCGNVNSHEVSQVIGLLTLDMK